MKSERPGVRWGRKLFRLRSYAGVPLVLLALFFGRAGIEEWIAGLGLIVIGELLRIASVAYTGPTTRSRRIQAPELVTRGPYRYTRNPIYLGNFFLGAGFLMVLSGTLLWLWLLYIVLFWLEYTLIVQAEEAYLEQQFGEVYRKYRRETPRFVPVPGRHSRSRRGPDPSLARALRSEKSTLLLITGILALALLKTLWLQGTP